MSPNREYRWLLFALLTLAAIGTTAAAQPGASTESKSVAGSDLTVDSSLTEYVQLAAESNPSLRRRYEEWMASMENIAVARGWPDPTVSYTAYLASVETALGPQRHAFGVSQTFPWFGKLSLRGDAAEQAALAAEQRFEQARLDLFSRTARAYYEYAFLARAVEITQENLDLMSYQESVARAKYKTDTARYSELIKAQVELGILEEQLRALEDERGARAAALNAALGRAATSSLPWPVPLEEPPVEIPDADMVRQLALQANPTLLAAQREVGRQERLAALARRNRYPDLMIGVNTIITDESDLTAFNEGGRDTWMAMVSFRLPLWQGKYRAAIREADARQRAAEHALDEDHQQIDAQVEKLLFELRDARRKIELYGGNLIPKAEQALRASDTAYRAGEASFLDFVDAERTLLRFQLDLARARADWGQRSVEVAALMGRGPTGDSEDKPRRRDDARQGDLR